MDLEDVEDPEDPLGVDCGAYKPDVESLDMVFRKNYTFINLQ